MTKMLTEVSRLALLAIMITQVASITNNDKLIKVKRSLPFKQPKNCEISLSELSSIVDLIQRITTESFSSDGIKVNFKSVDQDECQAAVEEMKGSIQKIMLLHKQLENHKTMSIDEVNILNKQHQMEMRKLRNQVNYLKIHETNKNKKKVSQLENNIQAMEAKYSEELDKTLTILQETLTQLCVSFIKLSKIDAALEVFYQINKNSTVLELIINQVYKIDDSVQNIADFIENLDSKNAVEGFEIIYKIVDGKGRENPEKLIIGLKINKFEGNARILKLKQEITGANIIEKLAANVKVGKFTETLAFLTKYPKSLELLDQLFQQLYDGSWKSIERMEEFSNGFVSLELTVSAYSILYYFLDMKETFSISDRKNLVNNLRNIVKKPNYESLNYYLRLRLAFILLENQAL